MVSAFFSDRTVRVRAPVGTLPRFLGQGILSGFSHSACLHPGVETGTGDFNAGGNPAMDWHPIHAGGGGGGGEGGWVEILLVNNNNNNFICTQHNTIIITA